LKDAAQETPSLSSKKIDTPEPTQAPREVSSKGESENSEKFTSKKNTAISDSVIPVQRKLESVAAMARTGGPGGSSAAVSHDLNSAVAFAATAMPLHSANKSTMGSSQRELEHSPILLKTAQGKSGADESENGSTGTGSGGESVKITESASDLNVAIGNGNGAMLGGNGNAASHSGSLKATGAGGDDSLNSGKNASSNKGAVSSASGVTDSKPSGPSMLGFMDASLSADPDMRQVWSEMSSNISRRIKEQPLVGQGTVTSTFVLNQNGHATNVETSPEPNELATSLRQTLDSLPSVLPPSKQLDKIFFQVKASNEANGTFVSLEINSQPNAITPDSLRDFKYQVTLQSYLKGIKKAIYSSWKPPVQEGVKPVMIGFKVSADGSVTDQRIVQSSGDPQLDKAALSAGRSVTKWSQPPAGTMDDLDICMVLQKCKACEAENNVSR
jgi:TonB family protein